MLEEQLRATLAELALENAGASGEVVEITDRARKEDILSKFGPAIEKNKMTSSTADLYKVAWHRRAGCLIVANVGAILYAHAPRSGKPHLVFHQGIVLYRPEYGIEMVNTGIVGNIYDGKIVVRAESACSPSFLFGSQRCNCRHQWECAQEAEAELNPANAPSAESGKQFERWVQQQAAREQSGKVRIEGESEAGFLLIHLDTQNGMGSGYTSGVFSPNLYTKASMRHRGEYSAEQVLGSTMAGAFEQVGLKPDPRGEDGGAGYQSAFIVMDFLGASRDLLFLGNNPLKWEHERAEGYTLTAIPLAGEVNLAGMEEAESRVSEFGHSLDAGEASFEDELARIIEHIRRHTT